MLGCTHRVDVQSHGAAVHGINCGLAAGQCRHQRVVGGVDRRLAFWVLKGEVGVDKAISLEEKWEKGRKISNIVAPNRMQVASFPVYKKRKSSWAKPTQCRWRSGWFFLFKWCQFSPCDVGCQLCTPVQVPNVWYVSMFSTCGKGDYTEQETENPQIYNCVCNKLKVIKCHRAHRITQRLVSAMVNMQAAIWLVRTCKIVLMCFGCKTSCIGFFISKSTKLCQAASVERRWSSYLWTLQNCANNWANTISHVSALASKLIIIFYLQALLFDADHHPSFLALHVQGEVQGALWLLRLHVGGQREGWRKGKGQAGASGGSFWSWVGARVAEDVQLRRKHSLQWIHHTCTSCRKGKMQD